MTIATELLRQHFETLVGDPMTWQGLLAPEIVWELPFAAVLGHPTFLSGRDGGVGHAGWVVGVVAGFRFFGLTIGGRSEPPPPVAASQGERDIKADADAIHD